MISTISNAILHHNDMTIQTLGVGWVTKMNKTDINLAHFAVKCATAESVSGQCGLPLTQCES